MLLEIEKEDTDEFLLEKLHVNSLNIFRNYMNIPEEGSPELEIKKEYIKDIVKEYRESLKFSKKLIELLLEKSEEYLIQ